MLEFVCPGRFEQKLACFMFVTWRVLWGESFLNRAWTQAQQNFRYFLLLLAVKNIKVSLLEYELNLKEAEQGRHELAFNPNKTSY